MGKPKEYQSEHRNLFGSCNSNILQYDGHSDCTNDALFVYSDCDGYRAFFKTHPEFSCIGWKK